MRLLNEQVKKEIDLKKEVHVALTLEDIAVIYAVMAKESTSSVQEKLREEDFDQVAENIDGWQNDVPYHLYQVTEDILEAEGVKEEDTF